MCLFAVVRQLREVLCGQDCDGDSCTCESATERQRVAAAILDHLWRGEPTGKTELDSFAAVVREHGLDRAWFERMAEAMARTLPPRVATWRRLREHVEAITAPAAGIAARVLGTGEATPQWVALGTAMWMTRLLERMRDNAGAGRVTLPLDDLVKCSMTDADVLQLCHGVGDERWAAVVAVQADRLRAMFDGGAKALASIPGHRVRRAAAVLVELERRRLERCIAAMLAGQMTSRDATLGERLGALPRAMRAAMKG